MSGMIGYELWKSEEERSFTGWNFGYLARRTEEEPVPWEYRSIIEEMVSKSDTLLDMGTGGGEFLLTLNHPYERTYVSEAYVPNVELCRQRLVPLGIDVRQVVDDRHLPYEADMFDVIVNRHEAYDIDEVYRILKPNGLFITQQVGGMNNKELAAFLLPNHSEVISREHALHNQVTAMEQRGFIILRQEECFPYIRFQDIGALVYFAKIMEWEFPGFTVDTCYDRLQQLHEIVQQVGYVKSKEHRFLIVARKC